MHEIDVRRPTPSLSRVQGCRPGQKLDRHIDITPPNRLYEYITKEKEHPVNRCSI